MAIPAPAIRRPTIRAPIGSWFRREPAAPWAARWKCSKAWVTRPKARHCAESTEDRVVTPRIVPGPDRPAVPIPAARIPAAAGIGLRALHEAQIVVETPPLAWLEVHSENYLLPRQSPRLRLLRDLRRNYPISCHGVGLSLGSAEGLSPTHLAALKVLFDDIEPGL